MYCHERDEAQETMNTRRKHQRLQTPRSQGPEARVKTALHKYGDPEA